MSADNSRSTTRTEGKNSQNSSRIIDDATLSYRVAYGALAVRTEPSPLSARDLQRINGVMRPYTLQFDLVKNIDQVRIQIVESDSGEVTRQMPSEAMLRVAAHREELSAQIIDQIA
ncbi:flagellar protein FlaG [Halioglobus sp. HI00S01]|uniref:flagellar protein FlaG n=1 Tax=Halioglobus sp. HI00S01 TaxID=1822214 RepID=UPI0018D36F15|nr:flagellar protein FlaG [Halioglobus sp. HI00S01]